MSEDQETCEEAVEVAQRRLTMAVRDLEAARSILQKAYTLSLQSKRSETQTLGREASHHAETVGQLRAVAARSADHLAKELGAL